jgi:hypothetical protein
MVKSVKPTTTAAPAIPALVVIILHTKHRRCHKRPVVLTNTLELLVLEMLLDLVVVIERLRAVNAEMHVVLTFLDVLPFLGVFDFVVKPPQYSELPDLTWAFTALVDKLFVKFLFADRCAIVCVVLWRLWSKEAWHLVHWIVEDDQFWLLLWHSVLDTLFFRE